MHRLITDNKSLKAACDTFSQCDFITVDTEFLREKTYYPKLCLVQIAGPDDDVAIDPLADGIDLQPLFELMANEKVVKVFHAAQQDVEIFVNLMGSAPTPLYDTQIAAMVCGFGESVGYEALVNKLLGEQLDKASRFTDWSQRPLTQRQVDYAIADVTHLRDIYRQLKERIDEQGRASWIAEEMAKMNDTESYQVEPNDSWKRLKYKNRSPVYLNMLRAAAAWRERTAQERDIPRGRLLKDDVVLQIASQAPKTVEELGQVRGGAKSLSADYAKSLVAALNAAREADRSTFPKDHKKRAPISPEQGAIIDVLRMLLKLQCETHHVAAKLVANKDDLVMFVTTDEMPDFMKGWRYEVFGKAAEDFISGKIRLCVEDKHLVFQEV